LEYGRREGEAEGHVSGEGRYVTSPYLSCSVGQSGIFLFSVFLSVSESARVSLDLSS
jgi:hypothetical protein